VSRNDRNILAESIRYYLGGRITNFEFMDRTDKLYRSEDKSVVEINKNFWFAYDDLSEHKNEGKHLISTSDENHAKRFILFLKSDLEYEWQDLGLRVWLQSIFIFWKGNGPSSQVRAAGNPLVWPFYSEFELAREISQPKYLS